MPLYAYFSTLPMELKIKRLDLCQGKYIKSFWKSEKLKIDEFEIADSEKLKKQGPLKGKGVSAWNNGNMNLPSTNYSGVELLGTFGTKKIKFSTLMQLKWGKSCDKDFFFIMDGMILEVMIK